MKIHKEQLWEIEFEINDAMESLQTLTKFYSIPEDAKGVILDILGSLAMAKVGLSGIESKLTAKK